MYREKFFNTARREKDNLKIFPGKVKNLSGSYN